MSATVPRTVSEALRDARRRLSTASFSPSTREASLLMAHVLDVDEVLVLAHPEHDIRPDRLRAYEALIDRRLEGEPVAYLTGEREFYGRRFRVSRGFRAPCSCRCRRRDSRGRRRGAR